MPEVSTKITPRIAELLAGGVITITTSWFSSGAETYGRVTQPHPRLGVFPHDSYKLEELEVVLEQIRVPSVYAAPVDSGPVTPRSTPTKKGQAVKIVFSNDPDIGKVPVQIGIHGVVNSLPKESLCWKDLIYLNDDQLYRRLRAIGKEMGADKAVAKLTSGSALNTTPAPTLFKWWSKASGLQRFLLVSNAKRVGKVNEEEKDSLLARLTAGNYPFRGVDRSIEEEEDDEEEEVEEGLTINFDDLNISD